MTNPEPVWTVAGATAAVTAVTAGLVAFGVDVTPEQTAAIVSIVAIAVASIGAFLARRKVTPLSNPKTDTGAPLIPATPVEDSL